MALTSTAAPKTTPAERGRRSTRRSAPSRARPTSTSLWPPLATASTVKGLSPTSATARTLPVLRQVSTTQARAAREARAWKSRRVARGLPWAAATTPPARAEKRGP